MEWVKVGLFEDFVVEKRLLFRQGNKQIVLFWSQERVYAIDNRCPHEGYPLKQGDLDEESCILTCQWHNWKFNLKDGKSQMGRDRVRTYPTRVEGGEIWIDLSEPTAEERQAEILEGLQVAVEKRQYGRISREVAKLHVHGLDPLCVVEAALGWSYDRLEFGTTHAYAVAADWLTMFDELAPRFEEQLVCLTELLDHISHDALRHPSYPFASGVEIWDGQRFVDAIEAEDEALAVRLFNGALEQGVSWSAIEYWLTKSVFSHYRDFGHALIYVVKADQMIARLGERVMPYLVLPMVRALCMSTKEDLLPEFESYATFLSELPKLEGDRGQWLEDSPVFGLSVEKSMGWLVGNASSLSVPVLYSALLEASARSLVMFDERVQRAIDNQVKHNVGWLHLTHALTFANAVYAQCEKFPEFWREGLLQMACFVGRQKPYLEQGQEVERWFVDDAEGFFEGLLDDVMDHGVATPILAAHRLKTALAVKEELAHVSPSCRQWMLAGLNRYLHASVKEKHLRRTARQSLALVGKEASF